MSNVQSQPIVCHNGAWQPRLQILSFYDLCYNIPQKIVVNPQNVESGGVPARVLISSHKDQEPTHWGQ
jgi:hypothetical protein